MSVKQFIVLFVALIIVSAATFGGVYYIKNKPVKTSEQTGAPAPAAPISTQDQQAEAPTSIKLLATGDMIAHDSINMNAKKADGTYDYAALMGNMSEYFKKGDINFCNQATPAGGESFGISGYPVFNAPVAFARGIEAIGCNLINIGTNHTNDKGQGLVDATVAAWDDRQILAVAGANRNKTEQDTPRIFTVKGMKFGFVAYTDYTNGPLPNTFGVNKYSDDLAKTQIESIRKQVDFVIVSMRWGTEYASTVNTRQDAVAQNLANYGADVVLGHGPHALQPVKRLKSADGREVVVWFSLGNFLNSQLNVDNLIGGFASMEIDLTTKKVSSIGFLPVYQHYEWSSSEKAANDLLKRKNFTMTSLDKAAHLLAKSQLNTTVEVQLERITKVLNAHTTVPMLTSTEFLAN